MSGIVPTVEEVEAIAAAGTCSGEGNPAAAIKPGAQFPLIGEDGEEEEEE